MTATSHTAPAFTIALLTALGAALLSCSDPTDAAHPTVASVEVSPTTLRLTVGTAASIRAAAEDAHGDTLSDRQLFWSSSDTSVAAVSGVGRVTGRGVGTAHVVASSEGVFGRVLVTVVRPPVASVTVKPSSAQAHVNDHVQFRATTLDSSGNVLTGRTITWSSSDQDVATVNDDGEARARGPGTAMINATSEGKTGSARLTVLAPVAKVEVNPPAAFVRPGGTVQFTAATLDKDGNTLTGRTVKWTSSDQNVATVDTTGLVTAVASGSATISATAEGVDGTAQVTVSIFIFGQRGSR
ncbi:MAG TPA: Ig-like domain-containing protein [Gemmatimonadaceae bacterium]|nr:Ig-like domain-containing protein [Gemmatimonadaceae bacterium]